MSDIIKTWPSFMEPEKVRRIFTHKWVHFYFSLGRGKPKQVIDRIWFTHRGRIVGCFRVLAVIINDGTLPKLRSLQNRQSEWQFKRDVWVAVCEGPVQALEEDIYHESFRGWRYFDLEDYRRTPDAKFNMETA